MRSIHHRSPSRPVGDRDRDTIERLRRGDDTGLKQLLEDHGGAARARLRQHFGGALDASELDEILALTIVRVWKVGARFDPALGSLRAWTVVIARNFAIRHLRSRGRFRNREQGVELDGIASRDRATGRTSERPRLVSDAHACLRKLPRLQRAVLLADLELGNAASAKQLARRLRTTPGSIYVSRLKGRRSLLRELRKLGHNLTHLEFLGTRRTREVCG